MKFSTIVLFLTFAMIISFPADIPAQDLDQIIKNGTLRHLSIPYANFNSGAGDGLDIEIIKLFADHIGVKYEYVETDWPSVIKDLTGKVVKPSGEEIEITGESEVKGDIVANGFTVLPWREKALSFSSPTFPTQVWLIANAESELAPIKPTGNLADDIKATRKLVKGTTVLGKSGTCLDLSLYNLEADGATGKNFEGTLNELAPALLEGESDLLILDVPDALVAINKWPGKIKILGPMSEMQMMGSGIRLENPKLLESYNGFLATIKSNGKYLELVRKYYPDVFNYYPEFFNDCK